MKQVLRAICLLIVSANVYAQSGTTVGGQYACKTQEYLDDLYQFAVQEDIGSARAYLTSGKCIMIKDGLQVAVVYRTGNGRVQIQFKDALLWTFTEAIRLNEARAR